MSTIMIKHLEYSFGIHLEQRLEAYKWSVPSMLTFELFSASFIC